jgi:hypothetical protein
MAAASMLATPAAAQQTNCSAGDLRPIAEGWLPTSIGLTLAEKRCEAREFLRRVFSSEEDPDNINPSHVLEASRPQLDPEQQRVRDEFLAAEKIKLREERAYSEHMRANMANEAVTAALEREEALRNAGIEITEPFQKLPAGYQLLAPSEPGGLPTLVQSSDPAPTSSLIVVNGDAIVLGPDGVQAGTFEGGQLSGVGEEIEPDGTWREGNFEDGQMEGPGLQVSKGPDGEPYMTTGDFEDDNPDGQVTVTYAGGSRQRQLWQDGQLVSVGPRASRGATPANAPSWKPSANVTTYQSALEYEMVPAKNGGKLEGTFESNGQPSGEMIRRYPDGTSQRELWEGGKVIGRGALSRPGGVPPPIGKVYRPQIPPRSTWKAAPARPAPRPVASSSGSGYSSVCVRNQSKLQNYISNAGGITWGARVHSTYMQMWAQCRGGDPEAEREYQENAQFLANYQRRGNADNSSPGFLNELNRAIGDPNYSAELGPVRGQASGGASGGGDSGGDELAGGGEGGPAPGTSVGPFEIANATLPQSFHSRYSATSLSPDTINQQMDSDPDLQRIQAEIDSTRDTITKLRLLIAQLEGRIVIMRQSQDFPEARRLIQGMVESRNSAIANCKAMAASPGICTSALD